MARYTKQTVSSGYQSTTTLNENLTDIETAIDDTLSRKGDSPNTMEATLDMNSNRIINLASPVSGSDAARLDDVTGSISITAVAVPSQTGNAKKPLTTDATTLSWGQVNTQFLDHTPTASGGTLRTLRTKFEDSVSVKDFGALGDGSTDDLAAIQNALDSGSKHVHAPAATYKVLGMLTIPGGVMFYGDGPESTIIDSSAHTSTVTAVLYCKGTGPGTAIEALSVSPTLGDTQLTFASAPSLAAGDILMMEDNNDNSYSQHQTFHHAGEYALIEEISASTADIVGGLYAGYTAGNMTNYKMTMNTVTIRDMSVKAPTSDTLTTRGIQLHHCKDSLIDNVKVFNSNEKNIEIMMSYNMRVSNCTAQTLNDSATGNGYGIAVVNSQHVSIDHCFAIGKRHSTAVTGDSPTGAVVNRDIKITNCTLRNLRNKAWCADIHGNSEYVTYSNNDITGGITFGGNFNRFINNNIHFSGQTDTGNMGMAFHLSEPNGFDFTIEGNHIHSEGDYTGSDRAGILDIGAGGADLASTLNVGGTFVFRNNYCKDFMTGAATSDLLTFRNRGSTRTMRVEISNNHFEVADDSTSHALAFTVSSGSNWDRVTIKDNYFYDCGPVLANVDVAFVMGNHVVNGGNVQPGIEISADEIFCTNNFVYKAYYAGILCAYDTSSGSKIYCSGNFVTGCNRIASGTTEENYGIAVRGETTYLQGNVVDSPGAGASSNYFYANTITDLYSFGNVGLIAENAVTNTFNIGVQSDFLVATSLPTSTPGGSDRLWNNSGVVNIT